MTRCLVALALALGTLACSSSRTWRRVDTPHFFVSTDLGSRDAIRAGTALETTRDALASAGWPNVDFDEKSEVYILANGLDFERYFGRQATGLFAQGVPPRFFLWGSPDGWELRRTSHRPSPSVLRHEMAHQLSAQVWPRQPLWFAEGFASFLEPVYYSEDQNHVVVGAVNHWALRAYRAVRTIKVRDAVNWKTGIANMPQREAQGLYGISWLFVHWLFHERPAELESFLSELGRGSPPELALQTVLPETDDGAIDGTLFEYQKRPRFDVILRPLLQTPVSEASLEERLLDATEVRELEGVLVTTSRLHRGLAPTAATARAPFLCPLIQALPAIEQ